MIKSFNNKGLEIFYNTGSKKGIQPKHAGKLARILDRLDSSITPQDMNLPGYRLHPLKGDSRDVWSVSVDENWRLTFYFEGVESKADYCRLLNKLDNKDLLFIHDCIEAIGKCDLMKMEELKREYGDKE